MTNDTRITELNNGESEGMSMPMKILAVVAGLAIIFAIGFMVFKSLAPEDETSGAPPQINGGLSADEIASRGAAEQPAEEIETPVEQEQPPADLYNSGVAAELPKVEGGQDTVVADDVPTTDQDRVNLIATRFNEAFSLTDSFRCEVYDTTPEHQAYADRHFYGNPNHVQTFRGLKGAGWRFDPALMKVYDHKNAGVNKFAATIVGPNNEPMYMIIGYYDDVTDSFKITNNSYTDAGRQFANEHPDAFETHCEISHDGHAHNIHDPEEAH